MYRASRLLAQVPFYIIISTIGFLGLPKKMAGIIAVLIFLGCWSFVNDYWYSYPERSKIIFPATINYYDKEFVKK
jgi:hypothetical protein